MKIIKDIWVCSSFTSILSRKVKKVINNMSYQDSGINFSSKLIYNSNKDAKIHSIVNNKITYKELYEG